MGRYKCAYNCEIESESDVKFFKFPLYNPRKLKKWLANMKWKDWTPTRFSVLCSNHFEEQYIDRTGKSVQLREDAVPTIFAPADETQSVKAPNIPRSKRGKRVGLKTSATRASQPPAPSPATATETPDVPEPEHTEEISTGDSQNSEKWRIIVDEGLAKINSFPHFFHGDYCVPRAIQWAPDDAVSTDNKDPDNVIEVTEAWQWLCLDVRGPLPETANGHRFILTVTDCYSRWVEAAPMQACLPPQVAKQLAEVVAHFGFPLGILSRLPHDIIHKINKELKKLLDVNVALVVQHQQTGTVDVTTQQLIDRMVSDLAEEHAADWDVYLPAKVFSMCFQEHSVTKERPFAVLCCSGVEPVQSPRELNFAQSKIQDSALVVRQIHEVS